MKQVDLKVVKPTTILLRSCIKTNMRSIGDCILFGIEDKYYTIVSNITRIMHVLQQSE